MNWLTQIKLKTESALEAGALLPMQSEEAVIAEGGRDFVVRWVSTLAKKNAAMPGGVRDPNFNPFLSPEPALTVGDLGEHVVILNKFPVCLQHLVLARKVFQEQLTPLDWHDFFAMATFLSLAGGLGFYNGGATAGASQRHKHVQWIPAEAGNARLQIWANDLPQKPALGEVARVAALPVQHAFVFVGELQNQPPAKLADRLLEAFNQACKVLDVALDAEGLLPALNVLVGDGWLLLVPRAEEKSLGISVNAVNFGGTIFVREVAQLESIRAHGVLNLLADVGVR